MVYTDDGIPGYLVEMERNVETGTLHWKMIGQLDLKSTDSF